MHLRFPTPPHPKLKTMNTTITRMIAVALALIIGKMKGFIQ
jgi:hypothetical protein